ncbi:hypothetical protein [Actinomadura sp. 6N118]|uniref:hypothetical protein n=1 Tax=Actinomadura sp. 6N118 TaxID=3375151 RepID=UPI0037B40D68
MLKQLVMSGIAGSASLMTFAATPAYAHDDDHPVPSNVQIIGIQTCRNLDVLGIGATIHNLLGVSYDSGDCINGSTIVHR